MIYLLNFFQPRHYNAMDQLNKLDCLNILYLPGRIQDFPQEEDASP